MQYMLLIYEDERTYADGEQGEAWQAIAQAHGRFAQALAEAGVIRGGGALKPVTTATTVRAAAGTRTVHDGPFAETREQLGGFYIVEAPDLDTAIGWARKLPLAADGSVEIRPLVDMPADASAEREPALTE